MQSRLTTWAVSSRDVGKQRLAREEERRQLRECQAAAAAAVSLPWPRVRKRGAGRPGRRDHWHALFYGIIERGERLPADVTNKPPWWWRPGMPVEQTAANVAGELMETSIVAGSLEKEQAGVAESPRKKYRKVDAEVKRWFLEFATLKKKLLAGSAEACSTVVVARAQGCSSPVGTSFDWRVPGTGTSAGSQ